MFIQICKISRRGRNHEQAAPISPWQEPGRARCERRGADRYAGACRECRDISRARRRRRPLTRTGGIKTPFPRADEWSWTAPLPLRSQQRPRAGLSPPCRHGPRGAARRSSRYGSPCLRARPYSSPSARLRMTVSPPSPPDASSCSMFGCRSAFCDCGFYLQ